MESGERSEEAHKELSYLEPYWQSLEGETDRGTAVLSAILLDGLLEQLIQASFIKDPRVKQIFKNDHVLQSFYAKINLAYFAGLIPKPFFEDLKLICEIRNKFAHSVVSDPKFTNATITRLVNRLSQIPESLREKYPPRLKFDLVVSHVAGLLLAWIKLISDFGLPNLVNLLKLEETNWSDCILEPEEIRNIIEGNKNKVVRRKLRKVRKKWAVLDLNERATHGPYSKLGNLIAFRRQITK